MVVVGVPVIGIVFTLDATRQVLDNVRSVTERSTSAASSASTAHAYQFGASALVVGGGGCDHRRQKEDH